MKELLMNGIEYFKLLVEDYKRLLKRYNNNRT